MRGRGEVLKDLFQSGAWVSEVHIQWRLRTREASMNTLHLEPETVPGVVELAAFKEEPFAGLYAWQVPTTVRGPC